MSMGLPFGPASRITPVRNPDDISAQSHMRSLHAHSPPRHIAEPKLHERGSKGHVTPPQLSQSPTRTRAVADEQRAERAAQWCHNTSMLVTSLRSVLDGKEAASPEAAKQFHEESSKWLYSYNKQQQQGGAFASLHGVVLQVTAALSSEDGTLALGDAERAGALRTLSDVDKELAREAALHATVAAAAAPH